MIGVLALAFYVFYLVGTFELQAVCTTQGHDNLSPQQAVHYGNDHVCQTTTSSVVLLVWNIVVAIVAIVGGAVAGIYYQEESENYAEDSKDKDFDARSVDDEDDI